MNFDISAVIVNYKTPDLSIMAVWSFHSHYPQLPIYLIDNDASPESNLIFTKLQKEIPNLSYLPQHKNLHHGPGMDLGIRSAQTDWVLTFDSDCIVFKPGFLEMMTDLIKTENEYMIGQLDYVDKNGKDITKDQPGYSYIHPKCALVKKSLYLTLPPFDVHGAPGLKNQIAASEKKFNLISFPVRDFVFHAGRGTVNRFGYQLSLRQKIKSLFDLFRKSDEISSIACCFVVRLL